MDPFEELCAANDAYHEAVKKVLGDSVVVTDVQALCEFADAARCVFIGMERAKKQVKSFYVKE